MIVLYGIRTWKRKVVAYRNDFCLACEEPRRALRIRSIKALHLFFIPVLPIYLWWHWECSECGRPPHLVPRAEINRKKIKKPLTVIFGVCALVLLISSPSETGNSPTATWILRILFTILFTISLWYTLKPASSTSLAEKLTGIKPDQDNFCPLCKAPLIPGSEWRCSGCGVLRTALRT